MEATSLPRKGRKRNTQRPAQILEAATAEFVEKGFAGARMDDVAARLGLVRGTLYRYFTDKENIFRAVVSQTMAPHVEALRTLSATHTTSFADLLRGLVRPMAAIAEEMPLGGVLKMVVGEARNFPQLARIWHDQLMLPAVEVLAGAVRDAQARGEVRGGEPRIYAFQVLSPLITALIWRETFVPVGSPDFNLEAVLTQCVEVFLAGALVEDRRQHSLTSHSLMPAREGTGH